MKVGGEIRTGEGRSVGLVSDGVALSSVDGHVDCGRVVAEQLVDGANDARAVVKGLAGVLPLLPASSAT